MGANPEFIFMLTRNDATVTDAVARAAEAAKIKGISIIGFKDVGLPFEKLHAVVDTIRSNGRTVAMEVVSLNADDERRSAEAALKLGVDMLLGGTRPGLVSDVIRDSDIRYFPFPGQVIGHPSVLAGTQQEIVDSAEHLAGLPGVHGLDLLAYRWAAGDPAELAKAVVNAVDVPVIAAGDVDRPERVRALAEAGVYGFTVGSAAFDGRFATGKPGLGTQLLAILEILDDMV
jgi:hypothetical protein